MEYIRFGPGIFSEQPVVQPGKQSGKGPAGETLSALIIFNMADLNFYQQQFPECPHFYLLRQAYEAVYIFGVVNNVSLAFDL